jgi:hypothetical protein
LTVISIDTISPTSQTGSRPGGAPTHATRQNAAVPGDTRTCWQLCSFQGPQKPQPDNPIIRPTTTNNRFHGRSLKTQQHTLKPRTPEGTRTSDTRPGPVDMTRNRPPSHRNPAKPARNDGRPTADTTRTRRWAGSTAPKILELP